MKAVHVYATYVEGLHEGISRNVNGLCRALAPQIGEVRFDGPPATLASLNRRRTHLRHGRIAKRLLRAALEDPNVDVVHHHVSIPAMAIFGRLARFRRAARQKPYFVHAWNAFYRAEDVPESIARRDRFYHALFNGPSAARWGVGRPDALIVSSRFQAKQWRSAGYDGPLKVVPSGVDTQIFRPATFLERRLSRTDLGLGEGPVLLYYGHLSPWKGVRDLLNAFPQILRVQPEAQLLVAHTDYGAHGDWLAREVRRLGLERYVHLRGVSHVPTLLAAADVAVLPHVAAVGTAIHPNVLLECLSAGVPVVGTRVGSIPEVLREDFGRLARPGDPHDLAIQTVRLLGAPDRPSLMGRAARRFILEHHDWSVVARRIAEVYREHVPAAPAPLPAAAAQAQPTEATVSSR
ncbi:MAG: glycosyltransferase family 4 protein [Euryarchaeota archaeon]|nr:glycosyltransferase family 4 protein [Euryarchaeota archaeon]